MLTAIPTSTFSHEAKDIQPMKVFLSDHDGSTASSDAGGGSDPYQSDSDEAPWPAGPIGAPPGLGAAAAPAKRATPLRSQAEAFVPVGRALAASAPEEVGKTTVMMRNVPLSYTCDSLIDLLESKGFSKCVDLVYVPMNFVQMLGIGCAFVNLTTPERAEEFMLAFEGFDGWASSFSKTACNMCWSNCQGLSENVSRYRNSPMMGEDVPTFYKPVFMKDGVRMPFPKPTKPLRTMRRRKLHGMALVQGNLQTAYGKGKEQQGED